MGELLTLQKAFTEHLRNPDNVPVPAGLDKRRMRVYSELIFNNVSALLSDFFPVIKSLLPAPAWDAMVRDFFISHQSETPYFMELSGEFVEYLAGSQLTSQLPGFLIELAHYEWIELALFTLDEELPEAPVAAIDLANSPLTLTSLAAPLAYRYPVHQISPDFQPGSAGEQPTYLLVTRNSEDAIRFFELQPLSYELLNAIEQNPGLIVSEWLSDSAARFQVSDKDQFLRNGIDLLASFNDQHMFTTGNAT